MKGHLRERSPGHWAIVIDVRDPAKRSANGMASRREARRSNEKKRGSNRRCFLTADADCSHNRRANSRCHREEDNSS
jgi:hypothetical protein